MLTVYKFVRLCLPRYYGYIMLIVIFGMMCGFSIAGLWPLVGCSCGLLVLYFSAVVLCKWIEKHAVGKLQAFRSKPRVKTEYSTFVGKPAEAKIKVRTPDGKTTYLKAVDQYEAALIVLDILKTEPQARFLIRKQTSQPFGRGCRYNWISVCGNLPFEYT